MGWFISELTADMSIALARRLEWAISVMRSVAIMLVVPAMGLAMDRSWQRGCGRCT